MDPRIFANKPAHEQTLRERYPKMEFVNPRFANLTLSELIKESSKIVKDAHWICRKDQLLFFLFGNIKCNQKLLHDFVIEASKDDNNYDLVSILLEMMREENFKRDTHFIVLQVTEDILKEHINSIRIIDFGISNTCIGPNSMEVILCAQDAPTDVLNVIISCRYAKECTSLLIFAYFVTNIEENLYVADSHDKNNVSARIQNLPIKDPTPYINKAITSIKFLCGFIEEYFPNDPNSIERIESITKKVGEYMDLIDKYNPQAKEELQTLLDRSLQSITVGQGNLPKPTF